MKKIPLITAIIFLVIDVIFLALSFSIPDLDLLLVGFVFNLPSSLLAIYLPRLLGDILNLSLYTSNILSGILLIFFGIVQYFLIGYVVGYIIDKIKHS